MILEKGMHPVDRSGSGAGRAGTVLVIEDNELNMKLVRNLLMLRNLCMIEAVNAEDGIEMARLHKPDMILMDIQLPGMDGLTATKIIKQDADLMHIPVVALTSYAMQGDEENALGAGCSGYISKPIDTKTFVETISQYLR